METTTTDTTLPAFEPVQIKKDEYRLGIVRMPDGINLRPGSQNRLKISVRYLKDGMHRQGRGIYLVMTGATFDGRFESHLLMQDPSLYLLIEPCKRFNAKALEKIAESVPFTMRETLLEQITRAARYYETRKGT